MARAFPDAAIHTSFHDPAGTFPEFAALDVRVAPIDRIVPLRTRHRLALPLLAPTFSAMRIDADVVVCSSSGWAHGVRTDGRKIVYCHAPARWLYQSDRYLEGRGRAAPAALRVVARPLKAWDRRAARSADTYLANSRYTADMIADAYGIRARVVHPPVVVDHEAERSPVPGLGASYWLCVARLLPYKNVDVLVDAFARMPNERLVVVGSGPEGTALRARAPRNVTFLHEVQDSELGWLYANARALVALSYEDFGLTPIEAASFGTPSVALRFGGYLDTVIDGSTGVFVDAPTPAALERALCEFRDVVFDEQAIVHHAAEFGVDRFARRLRDEVEAVAASPTGGVG